MASFCSRAGMTRHALLVAGISVAAVAGHASTHGRETLACLFFVLHRSVAMYDAGQRDAVAAGVNIV